MADDGIIYIPGQMHAEEAMESWLKTVEGVHEHLESSYAGLEARATRSQSLGHQR